LGFPVYSLRTGILTQLAFLIVAAMLLINVVMVKFSERDLIRAKVQEGRMLIHALEQCLGRFASGEEKSLTGISTDPRFKREVARLLKVVEFSGLTIVDRMGSPVLTLPSSGGKDRPGLLSARRALKTRVWSTDFRGTTWGVIWLNSKGVMISAPLFFDDRPLGGISTAASLIPVYQSIRKSQKVIFLYIVLDTLILALVGIYLLSRIVVKPIHKLLKMTEEYKEGEMIPSFVEASRSEIGELSRALNNMLKRLEENKIELKAHISSLEKANRELQEAQKEIVRSEKMASVGRLAAGIAHEIGNPIGITLGYLELLNKGDMSEEEKRDFLNRIEEEITRINRIIRQLLDFSRPAGGVPVETSVHEVILDTVGILNPQPMMEEIRVSLELEAAADAILADPNQLQQVFLNIIMNAADALALKGVDSGDGRGKTLALKSRNEGNTIEVIFADNGPGIAEEDLVRIFDPFYTTKEPGKGTGLGLSVCYRIVEGMGGTMEAEGSPGGGMSIRVGLPLRGKENRG
jgi:two-component system NtrC family sensor kinase